MNQNYKEFWHFYLREHSHPKTRRLHTTGTSLGFLFFAASLYFHSWLLLLLSFLFGYGFAWFSHFFIEKNKPASFKYPWKSFWADIKLLIMSITGEIEDEIESLKNGENES
tara:strand:+ start:197 stop:529 length:333 start_codon:yes stop_codon:yes gene_type:complete